MTIANKLLETLNERNNLHISESGNPYIGIFYIIENEVHWEGEHPREINIVQGGQKTYWRIHSQYWYQTLVKYVTKAKEITINIDTRGRKIAWKYLPRGRVVCSESNSDFIVYCDKHIANNSDLKSKIRSEMNLPYNTEFETDGSHYKCFNCSPTEFV
jgi:hypothetical protein